MTALCVITVALVMLFAVFGSWFGWQLLRQNGRMLWRLEGLERQLDELDVRAESVARARNHSLARSRINRDGLKAGTRAPAFRLRRLDGGELSLEDFSGSRTLLVFSDPHCGPCNDLAPYLEKFHRANCDIAVVMISRRGLKENRAKVKEHGITFPVVLQAHWEISRLYAMFATPIAYLIDEAGMIANDVALGLDSILELMNTAAPVKPPGEQNRVWIDRLCVKELNNMT